MPASVTKASVCEPPVAVDRMRVPASISIRLTTPSCSTAANAQMKPFVPPPAFHVRTPRKGRAPTPSGESNA